MFLIKITIASTLKLIQKMMPKRQVIQRAFFFSYLLGKFKNLYLLTLDIDFKIQQNKALILTTVPRLVKKKYWICETETGNSLRVSGTLLDSEVTMSYSCHSRHLYKLTSEHWGKSTFKGRFKQWIKRWPMRVNCRPTQIASALIIERFMKERKKKKRKKKKTNDVGTKKLCVKEIDLLTLLRWISFHKHASATPTLYPREMEN